MQKEVGPRNPWPIPTKSRFPCSNDWHSSRWRSLSTMGCSCGWRPHSPFDSTRILPLHEQMVASFESARFDCHAIEASFWFQRLQKEVEEELHVLTYSYKRKQLEFAQSSSFLWCVGQGSWWFSVFHSESQDGDAPSIEWTEWPDSCSIWQESSKMILTNSICLVTVGLCTTDVGLL